MNLKIENWKLLVLSAFYFIFSIVSYSVEAIAFLNFFRVAGIAIAIAGALQILIYFLRKEYLKSQDFSFSLGLILVFAGLILAFKAHLIVDNYRMVFAGIVVLDSILRMQYSMNLLRIQDKQWKAHTILAIVPALLGLGLILVNLGDMLANYFSFLLILDGIANVYTVLYYKRMIKKLDRIDHAGKQNKQSSHSSSDEDIEVEIVES